MTSITIPKKLTKEGDLVVIPRKEYERLQMLHKAVAEFTPTPAERKALVRAELNFKQGKTISYDELRKKLGITN